MRLAGSECIPRNVGLGGVPASLKYGTALIGELVHWPREQMPQELWPDCGMEFIPYMGQAFNGAAYPLLSQLHPTNVLPADMRGVFARGVDNRRGIDLNRGLMTEQGDAIRNIVGEVWTSGGANYQFLGENVQSNGAFEVLKEFTVGSIADGSTGDTCPTRLKFDTSRVVPTATENRPRNVAWQFIVRAK